MKEIYLNIKQKAKEVTHLNIVEKKFAYRKEVGTTALKKKKKTFN